MSRYPFLDFLRSLSIMWLIGYHSYWFLGLMLKPDQVQALFSTGFSKFLFLGHNGVDIFFVLSGFLICRSALSLREKFPTSWIKAFFIKRIFRILPALVFVVGLAFLINLAVPVARNLHNVWANILMINNYLSVTQQALGWTWSLAIEEQFYLIFPFFLSFFVLKPKLFLPFCTGLLVISLLIKHFVLANLNASWQSIPFHPVLTPADFVVYFDSLYSKTHVRFGPIVVGVMSFLIFDIFRQTTSSGSKIHPTEAVFLAPFQRALKLPNLFLGVGLLLVITPLTIDHVYFETVFQKTLFSIGIAILILRNQMGSISNAVYSWNLWKKLAQWSYSAFLVNPFIILILAGILIKKEALNSPLIFAIYLIFCQILTFGLAALIFKFVETPMSKIGQRKVEG